MNKNHGEIKPQGPPPPLPPPRIPHALRGVVEVFSGSLGYAMSCAKYGLWECEATEEIEFFHTTLQPGDRAKLPGNVCVWPAQEKNAAGTNYKILIKDQRLAEEEKVIAEAARLAIPLAAKNNPAFQKK